MEGDPFKAAERGGDIIPQADIDSAEFTLYEPFEVSDAEEHHGFTAKAAQAASNMGVAEIVEVALPSSAETAYSRASDLVDRRMDQGLDGKAAWEEADPTGDIRRNWEREEQERQNVTNRTNADAIRRQIHDAKVAEIEKIYNPVQREQAMSELLAAERVAQERRGRRA